MSENRRLFLNRLGLGAVASSLLALPSSALAFGRRRKTACEPVCEPVVEVRHRYTPYMVPVGPLRVSFPTDPGGAAVTDPVAIPGGGVFPVHGGWTSGVQMVTGLHIMDTGTSPATVLLTSGAGPTNGVFMLGGLPAMRFAFYVFSTATVNLTTRIFEIRLSYRDSGGVLQTLPVPGFYQASPAF